MKLADARSVYLVLYSTRASESKAEFYAGPFLGTHEIAEAVAQLFSEGRRDIVIRRFDLGFESRPVFDLKMPELKER